MTELIRLWRGEMALVRAFWHWAVLGGLAANGVTSLLFLALASRVEPGQVPVARLKEH